MIPIPEELLEQFERGNVLLFIGEHVARDAAGQAVVDRLTAQLAARSEVTDKGELSFPEAAQAYEDDRGRQALVQIVRDRLEEMGDEPQQAHRLIAGLTDCEVLATTCLDRRLERAFEAVRRSLDVVIGNVDVAFGDEHKAQLYKLRGSVEQAESLVLTEDDYEVFFENLASISVVLQGYLARKTVLFVGYDLTDPTFKRLYRKVTAPLDDYARRAYAFGEAPPRKVCRWCERHGIEVVETDATAFLEALTGQLTARRVARARPATIVPPQPVEEPAVPLPQRPYKLLDYYEANDAAIFFGRRQETQHLTSLIHAHRLVLLYGASGVGKTSLLLAGAVPWLEHADPPYETVYVRALEDPAHVIRRALRRRLPEAELLEEGSLVDFLDAATKALGRTLVIVLDQFEEFFIRLSPEFRAAFIAELGALYDARDVPVKVVLSLREDWLATVGEIETRIPEVFRTRMRLLPLTHEQARQAITAPVERLGVDYEPALVEQLLDDLTTGASAAGSAVMPPQLQIVCSALYDGLGPDQRRIALSAYERLGGAQGVLQKYLEDELARLGRDVQALARDALEELVTSQRTKAVKTGDELALALGVDAAELEPVLEKLVRARLLRPEERAGETARAFELAHEYLIAEITLSPETVSRKEAEELLKQGVDNWQRFGALLSAEAFELVDAQRDRLRLGPETQELMLRGALRHGRSVAPWLARMENAEQALALTQAALLEPQGEPARRSLGVAAGNIEPQRLRELVARLAARWREGQGAERACASDALWALRPYLPPRLRLRLALSRSPRLMRRVGLPVAGALVAALAFALILWGPRLWTPRPEIDWVEVPAGEFMMGSDPEVDPDADPDEAPPYPVYVDAYHISRYEITNAQYARCVRATVCEEPGDLTYYSDPNYANHPVVYVSWFNAQAFCKWMGGRLPTEAEWEYAARGPEGHIYPWGDDPPTCERAQFKECAGDLAPVGTRPDGASWCGTEDMAGNVWEWTADWYGPYPYEHQENPTGQETGEFKVERGGSFDFDPGHLRAADRVNDPPGLGYFNIGFRCVGPPGK